MNGMSFETALKSRTDQMLGACIKCGKCVEICPSVEPAGIAGVSAHDVIAGILDALAAFYHSDALCAHERDWPFRIVNFLEIVGQSMGLYRHDRFKDQKIMQDADLILAECRDLTAAHSLDPEQARRVVAKAMLGEQPLPLIGPSEGAQSSARGPSSVWTLW